MPYSNTKKNKQVRKAKRTQRMRRKSKIPRKPRYTKRRGRKLRAGLPANAQDVNDRVPDAEELAHIARVQDYERRNMPQAARVASEHFNTREARQAQRRAREARQVRFAGLAPVPE